MRLLLRWALLAAALIFVTQLLPGIHVGNFSHALVAALVLGLINLFVRPILVLLTLPVTVVTLGLFLIVINALTFLLASHLLPTLHVDGFGWALAGSLLYSVCGSVINAALER
ncbi:phage holin family protein [Amphibiibacter pelophylacis]|uniref:Phage holin family protein n=1 Tax=Amphibiibacter pelophylacis TaxID=1799477 RepID=A0ACC6P1G7_9BURK